VTGTAAQPVYFFFLFFLSFFDFFLFFAMSSTPRFLLDISCGFEV
jgi:hypothetical protein